jgi:hypothetical protein
MWHESISAYIRGTRHAKLRQVEQSLGYFLGQVRVQANTFPNVVLYLITQTQLSNSRLFLNIKGLFSCYWGDDKLKKLGLIPSFPQNNVGFYGVDLQFICNKS